MSHKRAEEFREKALAAKIKAGQATNEGSRRAWEIVARHWKAAADREEAKDTLDLNVVYEPRSAPKEE